MVTPKVKYRGGQNCVVCYQRKNVHFVWRTMWSQVHSLRVRRNSWRFAGFSRCHCVFWFVCLTTIIAFTQNKLLQKKPLESVCVHWCVVGCVCLCTLVWRVRACQWLGFASVCVYETHKHITDRDWEKTDTVFHSATHCNTLQHHSTAEQELA